MDDASVTLFEAALTLAVVSSALYVGHAFGARIALRRTETYPPGGGVTVATFNRLPDWLGRLATFAGSVALVFLIASLFSRWLAVGHAPWSNMWEYSAAFSGGILLFALVFERWHGQRALGAIMVPVAAGLMAVSAIFFPSEIRPLVPALQNSDILAAHVGVMILAYGALSVSFGAAIIYLLQGGQRNRFSRLPSSSRVRQIAYTSTAVGFPLLTAGIALGAYWANSAWGRYWGWDPKETSILISWLVYGLYLHTHNLKGWSGTRSAVILLIGYASIMFSYFAVNLYVAGLHSYSGV